MQEGHVVFDNFMEVHQAKNLVKEPTCYKNIENPSCVDLFVTGSQRSFMKTTVSFHEKRGNLVLHIA